MKTLIQWWLFALILSVGALIAASYLIQRAL